MSGNGNDSSCPGNVVNLLFHYGYTSYFLNRYILPLAILVGIFGNALILLVLNSKNMRNRTTLLLSCLAVTDISFLLVSIVPSFYSYSLFATDPTLRRFYNNVYIQHLFLQNWLSAGSIWFTLAVTIERAMAIMSPLSPHLGRKKQVYGTILLILLFTFLISFYINLCYRSLPYCLLPNSPANTSKFKFLFQNDTTSLNMWTVAEDTGFCHISFQLHPWTTIWIPLSTLTILNGCLIFYVRRSHQSVQMHGSVHDHSATERRLTTMVCVIVGSFILCNVLSAIIPLCEITDRWDQDFFSSVSNFLVIMNKVINFVLYCLSSQNFRKNAFQTMKMTWRKQTLSRSYESTKMTSMYSRSPNRQSQHASNRNSLSTGHKQSLLNPSPHRISQRNHSLQPDRTQTLPLIQVPKSAATTPVKRPPDSPSSKHKLSVQPNGKTPSPSRESLLPREEESNLEVTITNV